MKSIDNLFEFINKNIFIKKIQNFAIKDLLCDYCKVLLLKCRWF